MELKLINFVVLHFFSRPFGEYSPGSTACEHVCYDWSSLSDFISLSLCSRGSKGNLV